MPKTIVFDELGGPEVLRIVDLEMPRAEAGEAIVRMAYAGLNRAELLFAMGAYLQQPTLPKALMGVEGAGVVERIDSDSSEIAIGDRVAVAPAFDFDSYGVLGEYAKVPVSALIPVPKDLDLKTAAATWMAYGTAYGMLVTVGGLKKDSGALVIITAASSSVGVAALQIAKEFGATTVATTRTGAKAEQLKAAGADHVIITDDQDLTEEILAISDGRGFNIACDSIAGSMVEKLARCAASEANIVCMGLQSGEVPAMPLFDMLGRGLSLSGFHLRFGLLQHEERRQEMIGHVTERLLNGRYKPEIAREFAFSEVPDAYRFMASNEQFGKIVVAVDGGQD